jgi:hypothetical protein
MAASFRREFVIRLRLTVFFSRSFGEFHRDQDVPLQRLSAFDERSSVGRVSFLPGEIFFPERISKRNDSLAQFKD